MAESASWCWQSLLREEYVVDVEGSSGGVTVVGGRRKDE
jgi:hypothetical protein